MARDTKYLRGLDKALASLKRLREDAAPALVIAMNKSVEEMAARARLLASSERLKRDGVRTDTDVSARAVRKGTGLTARVVEAGRANFRARVYVPQNPYFWARFLEFGTRAGVRKNKRRGFQIDHPGTAARPFFWPAVRSLQKRATNRVKRALNAAAKRSVSG